MDKLTNFEDILSGTKEKKDEITDPKLLRLLKRKTVTKRLDAPNITLVTRKTHRPSNTISLVIDGVKKKPRAEVMEVYKCNKCGNTFNYTHAKILSGVPPHCPSCDE